MKGFNIGQQNAQTIINGSQNWIDANDGLPKDRERVLGFYINDHGKETFVVLQWTIEYGWFNYQKVTHWMPLPASPLI